MPAGACRAIFAGVMDNDHCCTKLVHEVVTSSNEFPHVLRRILVSATEGAGKRVNYYELNIFDFSEIIADGADAGGVSEIEPLL